MSPNIIQQPRDPLLRFPSKLFIIYFGEYGSDFDVAIAPLRRETGFVGCENTEKVFETAIPFEQGTTKVGGRLFYGV
jgi:hypothetical protein